MPAGRPTKYTPEIVEKIVNGVKVGLTYKDAALIAGIEPHTLTSWEKKYPSFSSQLAQARSQRSARWLTKLQEAGAKDWRAYEALLDRCAPDYRKTQSLEVAGKDGAPLLVIFTERRDGPQ